MIGIDATWPICRYLVGKPGADFLVQCSKPAMGIGGDRCLEHPVNGPEHVGTVSLGELMKAVGEDWTKRPVTAFGLTASYFWCSHRDPGFGTSMCGQARPCPKHDPLPMGDAGNTHPAQ